jgi:hypothetical protein
MTEPRRASNSELMADHALITEAIARGVREAVLQHARAGRPVPIWQDGKVVWIPPDEILARLQDGARPSAGARGDLK